MTIKKLLLTIIFLGIPLILFSQTFNVKEVKGLYNNIISQEYVNTDIIITDSTININKVNYAILNLGVECMYHINPIKISDTEEGYVKNYFIVPNSDYTMVNKKLKKAKKLLTDTILLDSNISNAEYDDFMLYVFSQISEYVYDIEFIYINNKLTTVAVKKEFDTKTIIYYNK